MKSIFGRRGGFPAKLSQSLDRSPALTLLIVALLFTQACQIVKPSKNPSNPDASSFPTLADSLASTQPADQTPTLLAGLPLVPADLTHYTIRLELDYSGHSFKSNTRIDYTNTETEALESLFFRLYPNLGQSYGDGRISVLSARLNGLPVETRMSMNDSVVEVRLPAALAPGGSLQVDFETSGSIPLDFGAGDPGVGYGMYNLTEGVLALANFYPMLAVYEGGKWWLDPVYVFGDSIFSDAALYTVEVFTDPNLVVVTSGLELSERMEAGLLMHRILTGPARDFFLIASPDYQVTSRGVGGTTINSYFLPGDAAGGAEALETAARALEIFNAQFGPYPYTQLDIVEAPLNRPSGIEFPGLVLIAERLYADMSTPEFNTTVSHEVAHQWWYNTVGNDVLRAPWMDEALTTYSSVVYWEQMGGETAKQQALAYYQERYDQNTNIGWDAPVTSPMAYFQEYNRIESYGPVVYAKGGLFFEELRQAIGDEAFFKAVQFYYGTHWFTIATSSELLGAFQTATDLQLDSLYQTWLYLPEVSTPTPAFSPTSTPTPAPTLSPAPTDTLIPTMPPTQTLEPTGTPTITSMPEPSSTPFIPPTEGPGPTPLIFAVIGDYGGGDDPDTLEVAQLIVSWNPEFIITLGDNNYLYGEYEHIDIAIGQYFHHYIYPYQGTYGHGADFNRFFPTLGNHDMMTDNGQPYLDYFTLPGNERYYDFEWGPVHLYALDNLDTEPDGSNASSIQAAWLQERLLSSTSPWNIVYGHYPPYSSGRHGSTLSARWPFSEWGVDAMLAGHDHTYERLYVDGVTYFVNGMGGFAVYDFKDVLEWSQARYNSNYGAIRVEATKEYLLFQFFNRDNVLIDQVELRK